MPKKASNKQEIMMSVSSVLSFIKERLKADLKEASDRKMINLEANQIESICAIAESSIDSSFFKSSSSIEKAIK